MSTILVVDDTEADRQILQTILQAKGHTVLEACTGKEALQQLRQHHPALVIVDIYMPEMDGLQLVAHLRADPSIANTPVVFHTVGYDECDTQKAMSAYGYAVLAKPVPVSEVTVYIEAILNEEKR